MELWKKSEINEIRKNYFGRAVTTGKAIDHPVTGKYGLLREYPDGGCEVVDPDGNSMIIKMLEDDPFDLDDEDRVWLNDPPVGKEIIE